MRKDTRCEPWKGAGPPHAGKGLIGLMSLLLAPAMRTTSRGPRRGRRSLRLAAPNRALEVFTIVNTQNGAHKSAEPRAGACAGVARERINPDSHHRDPGWARDGQVMSAQSQCSSHHFSCPGMNDPLIHGKPHSDVRSSSRASATCGPASARRVSIERGAASASPPRHKSARGQNAGVTSLMATTASRIRHTLGRMFLPEGFPQVSSLAPPPDQRQSI